MRHLRSELERRSNVAFIDGARVSSLVVRDGVVEGLVVEQNSESLTIHAKEVVLAVDGFAGSDSLLERFCPDLGKTFYGGVSNCVGEAVPWLETLGVDLVNMSACLRSGLVVVGVGTRINPALQFHGAVFLDVTGQRFVDEESLGYSALAGLIQRQPGEIALAVWDGYAMEKTRDSEMMRECLRHGAIKEVAGLDELAAWLDVPTSVLDASLRALPGRRQLRPPLYLARITHGVLTSQGGANVDLSGRVLRRDGTIVEGLRAGGGTAIGLSGPRSDGYSSGNGLLSAFGLGWIIGNNLSGIGTVA